MDIADGEKLYEAMEGRQVFVGDTNARAYAADRDAPGHERCRKRLLAYRAQPEPWYLTWSVVYPIEDVPGSRGIWSTVPTPRH